MQKFLADLPFFVEVAKRKSFTQAADALDIPLPTISRRIAALEKSLGVQLFNRNSRKVELTEAGLSFYERSEFIVAEAQNTLESLLHEQNSETGRIRLALPATTYFLYMQGAFSSFVAKYPSIEMHVYFATHWVDLYTEPYDLEIRTGVLPDSDLIVRKLITNVMGIYASPELLKRYSIPKLPQDLANLPYIHMTVFPKYQLELYKDNKTEIITMKPVHVVNSLALGLEFLLAGQGIAAMETNTARQYEQTGKLVRLIPRWNTSGVTVNLVRSNGKISHRIQLFIEHLIDHFKRF